MIIGLMGYGGAGKSTAAQWLREAHGFQSPHIGLPIKNMLRSLLRDADVPANLIERYIDGDLKRTVIPELGVTATEAQQRLGTEWGRKAIREDLWLSIWLHKVDSILAAGGRVVSESVRFPNEYAALRERGALMIEIRRPGFEGVNGHESEAVPGVADCVVMNDGGIGRLGEAVDDLVRAWATLPRYFSLNHVTV